MVINGDFMVMIWYSQYKSVQITMKKNPPKTSHTMFAAAQVRATRLMASVAFRVKMISSAHSTVPAKCKNTQRIIIERIKIHR